MPRLIKVSTIRKKDYSYGTYVYYLVGKGKIKAYRNLDDELMVDRDELKDYKKPAHKHKGRPLKVNVELVDTRRKKIE